MRKVLIGGKTMKRLLACLLLVSFIVGATACTKEAGKNGQSDDVPTLVWYLPGDELADIDSVEKEVNKITVPEIGAKIDMQYISVGAFTERMNMLMASSTEFDLCFTGFVNPYYDIVSKGGLKQIDDLLEETPDLKESLPDYIWDAAKVNGKLYAVPNQQIITSHVVPVVFKDLAEKYDLDPSKIKKIEDLEPFLEKIKKNEPNYIPWRTASGEFTVGKQYENIKIGFGVDRNDPDCKVVYIHNTEAHQKGREIRKRWFEKGYIRPDEASIGDDTLDYTSGKYAVFQTTYKPGVERDLYNTLGREVIVLDGVGEPYVSANSGVSTMIGISRTSKHPEKAIKFIELLNTNIELYNLISYGIEGKHYNLTSDNKVQIIDDGGYAPRASWKFGNQFNAYVPDGTDSDVWEKTKELNESAVKSPLLGFVLDTKAITSELSQCESIRSEYSAVSMGINSSKKDYEDYRRRMKEAGEDIVIAEIQRQVDEFLKNK